MDSVNRAEKPNIMEVHHYTYTGNVCVRCERKLKMFWYDKKETNGFSETLYKGKYCPECNEAITGKRNKTLIEINKERAKHG